MENCDPVWITIPLLPLPNCQRAARRARARLHVGAEAPFSQPGWAGAKARLPSALACDHPDLPNLLRPFRPKCSKEKFIAAATLSVKHLIVIKCFFRLFCRLRLRPPPKSSEPKPV